MKDDVFIKLNKKSKLNLPYSVKRVIEDVVVALLIPTRKKRDGYVMSAFFVKTKEELWHRVEDYDCFSFYEGGRRIKGDFENDGVQFFLGEGWQWEYGGEFIKTKSI